MIGAAIGSLLKNKPGAFATGLVSHAAADMLPHKDVSPALDVPMMAATLAAIAKLKGIDSPEFWGAVGAVAPDAEHGLLMAGLIKPEQEIFPTHIDNGKWHGPRSGERMSQVLLAAAAVLVVACVAGNTEP